MVIGKCYLVKSVTSHDYVGEVVEIVGPHTVVLNQCSWVEDSGRLGAFVRNGSTPEMAVEFLGDGIEVHWADAKPWNHKLFSEDV